MSVPARGETGSLVVVGTGIRPGLHLTQEARALIERAEDVLYLLAEIAPTEWIRRLNPAAKSLLSIYRLDRDREDVYEEIVETTLARVRRGRYVCLVTYGHPSVFDDASQEAVRRAIAEGFEARLVPAISALDCVFVDLEVDPGAHGLQLYDATDFLVHRRSPDVTVPLLLWQISVIGRTRASDSVNRGGLTILAERLAELYRHDHEVIVYEASPFPIGRPLIECVALDRLPDAGVTGLCSLYVPPVSPPATPDPEVRNRVAASGDASS